MYEHAKIYAAYTIIKQREILNQKCRLIVYYLSSIYLFGNVSMAVIPVFKEMINYWLEIVDTGSAMKLCDFTHFPTKFNACPTTNKSN